MMVKVDSRHEKVIELRHSERTIAYFHRSFYSSVKVRTVQTLKLSYRSMEKKSINAVAVNTEKVQR